MQYILTEDEYNKLKDYAVKRNEKEKEKLFTFCKHIADTMPVVGWHADTDDDAVIINGKKAAVWGCIYTVDDWYCDECPCTQICPMNKRWSK